MMTPERRRSAQVRRRAAATLLWLLAGTAAAALPRVADIAVRGGGAVPEKELLRAAGLSPGDEASPQALRSARERATLYLRGKGYLEAEAEVEGHPAAGGVSLRLLVREGPLYHFGAARIEGLARLPEMSVRRELAFRSGEPYDRRKLFETRGRLFLTGLFQEVRVDASTMPAKTADVVIRVKERPLRWIKGGVGWGSEESQRATLSLVHENLFRRAYKGELTSQWSRIWREERADLITRYFLGTRTQLRSSVGWRSEKREGYRFERVRAEETFSRPLMKHLTGSAGYQFDRTVTFGVNPQIAAVTPDLSDSRSLVTGLEWDGANDYFFPTEGVRSRLRLQRAGGRLGGTIHFNKAYVETKAYQSLGRRWVAAAAARAGAVRPFGPSRDVPVFDRFFTGGANSVRGYRERGVGPKDQLGSPLGGTWTTGADLELRFPLFRQLFGATFIDGGAAALSRREALPSEWKYGAGAGLRLRTPVGPVRLDYGRKLNPDPGDPEHWRIHLSLGESF